MDFDKVIFSSNKPPHVVMNFLADRGLEFRVLLGGTDFERELSYIVEASTYPYLNECLLLEGRDSVLFLGATLEGTRGRLATVHLLGAPLDEAVKDIGTFISVPRAVAENMGGWVYEPVSQQWFTIIPT